MPLLALIITLKFVHTLTPYALPFWMLRDTFFFFGGGGGGGNTAGMKNTSPIKT